MAMGTGRGGREPSAVTCRIGGDRPGCDFMITTLGERRADTGTSTGRFDVGGTRRPRRGGARPHPHLHRRRQEPAKAQGKHMAPPSLTPAQRKEAIRRRARGATLQELAIELQC